MSNQTLVIYGFLAFGAQILSGISGGGAGFILTPLAIFLGLPPQNAIATGKLGGLAVSVGSVEKLRKAKLHDWRVVIPIMILAAVIGLIAPFFITKIDNDSYRHILGVLLIAMIPILFIKKTGEGEKDISRTKKILGYGLLALTLFMQAIFSSGMGAFVNIALMMFLGMTALEANVTKRFSQIILNTLIVLGVIGSGLIVWKVAGVVIVTGFVGGQIGARLALNRGNQFVMIIFAVLMFLSGLELLFG